jgi:hypothetical protein
MKKKSKVRAEDLEAAVRGVVSVLRGAKLPYMLIGALALPVWGRPRATLDIDFMIMTAEIPERLVKHLGRIGFELDFDWERENRFLKGVQSRFRSTTLTLDILLLKDSHHENAFRRRKRKRYGGMTIWFPSAEDLILLKLRAGRPTDFDDAAGVVNRVGKELDLHYLSTWARRLGIIEELNYVVRAL